MRRRTSLPLALGLTLGLTASLLVGCSDPAETEDPAVLESTAASGKPLDASNAGWTRIEGFPLSDRTHPLLAELGGELYVIGGNTGSICPPLADCASPVGHVVRDGAAYDPATGAWRTIADLPRGSRVYADGWLRPQVVDGLVLVSQDVERAGVWRTEWLAYDPQADSWERVEPLARLGAGPSDVATDGETLWVLDGRRVLTLDPRTGEQAQIGRYPRAGSLRSARLLPGPSGPAVAGWVRGAAPDEPALAAVDVMAGAGRGATWRRLETEMYGEITHFTGSEFVGLEWGRADGGATNNWGRWYDAGGRVRASDGEWTALDVPEPDDVPGEVAQWTLEAVDGPRLATSGFVVDLGAGDRWQRIQRPVGAEVDTEVSAVWDGDWLVAVGGVDLEGDGYRAPAPTEVWAYRPPGD
ncbi:MAG: hypothetical protein ACI379_13740 [Nocardioides sp.]|uniref:hypothetical protein n=1 Tax=Nocardioides sp. TaxID=35761 RepID=UPI003F08EE42